MNGETLTGLLKKGQMILAQAGIKEAGLDAWLLLEFKTGKNRAYYFAHGDEPVSDETAAEYLKLIGRRAGHIPVQQLTHQAFFMGYEFYVNQDVLIPRQDTETLVEEALKCMNGMKEPEILDMCTGSAGKGKCKRCRRRYLTGSSCCGKKECKRSGCGETGRICGK